MDKEQAIREALLLSRYSIALNYVDFMKKKKRETKKAISSKIKELEREYDFNIDIERDRCAEGEPDAVFSKDEWNDIDLPI